MTQAPRRRTKRLFIEEMITAGAVGGVCRSVKDVADLIDKAVYCQCGYTGCLLKYCPYCSKENDFRK